MNLKGCDPKKIMYPTIKELVPVLAGVHWNKELLSSLTEIVEELLSN